MRSKASSYHRVDSDSNSDSDSDYFDGEEHYKPKEDGDLGEGVNVTARLFDNENKATAVLKPHKPHDCEALECSSDCESMSCPTLEELLKEAAVKQEFFNQLYPDDKTELFTWDNPPDYRLIVPYKPGVALSDIDFSLLGVTELIELFVAVIREVQRAHALEIVIMDLKADNILYDKITKQCFLIDGGLSLKVKVPLPDFYEGGPGFPPKSWIAPECWHQPGTVVLASLPIDVYSMGSFLRGCMVSAPESINRLIERCLDDTPENRINLLDLLMELGYASRDHVNQKTQVKENLQHVGVKASDYDSLLEYIDLDQLVGEIEYMHRHQLLTQENASANLDVLKRPQTNRKSTNLKPTLWILAELQHRGMLTEDKALFRSMLSKKRYDCKMECVPTMVDCMVIMHKHKLLDDSFMSYLFDHKDIKSCFNALTILEEMDVLNHKANIYHINRQLLSVPRPHEFAMLFAWLDRTELLQFYHQLITLPNIHILLPELHGHNWHVGKQATKLFIKQLIKSNTPSLALLHADERVAKKSVKRVAEERDHSAKKSKLGFDDFSREESSFMLASAGSAVARSSMGFFDSKSDADTDYLNLELTEEEQSFFL